jgi:hypothetical protein
LLSSSSSGFRTTGTIRPVHNTTRAHDQLACDQSEARQTEAQT